MLAVAVRRPIRSCCARPCQHQADQGDSRAPLSFRVLVLSRFIREVLWAVCTLEGSGVAGTFLQAVRTRGVYTGESSRWLVAHASLSRSMPIPDAADSGQTRLEAAVFRALTSCGEYTPNPAGVLRTRLIADGSTVVHVDRRSAGFPNEYEVTELIAATLLPCAIPDGGFEGAAGVRVAGVNRGDLALTFVDTSARVTLRAAPKSRWDTVIEQVRERLELAECKPLWDAAKSIGEERYLLESSRRGLRLAGMDWLASGLLRRIALYRTIGLAYAVSAWTSGNTWKIEIDTDPVHGAVHSRFLAALTDPLYGLPLRVRDASCMCGPRAWPPGSTNRDCWYELDVTNGTRVELQLRFRHRTPPARLPDRLIAAGADPAGVRRALPPSLSSSTAAEN
jgi:hypothetical protein